MKLSRVLFLLVLLSSFFTSIALAQDAPPAPSDYTNQTIEQWANAKNCAKEENGICAEAYTNFMMNSLMHSMTNAITGAGDIAVAKNPEEVKNAYNKSLIGATGKYISYMFDNPPASGIQYIASSINNFALGKTAYAQGIGYSGLQPLQPLWRAFRNLSYVILAIILVAVGFMIMFRMKLDAQTAISIQNALPNIVITLILITFSYAIAGLLIDLMYFLTNVIITLFVNSGFSKEINGFLGTQGIQPVNVSQVQSFYTNANVWDLMQSVINWETVVTLPNTILRSGIGNMWSRLGSAETTTGDVTQFFLFSAGTVVGVVGGVLLPLLIALGLLYVFVRLFFMFLNSYIQILLSVILAPVELLLGAIPGQSAFKNWFMGLVGNLIIFPAAVGLFMLNMSISVMALSSKNQGTTLWTPPFLFGTSEGTVGPSVPIALIGFGLLMLTPSLLTTIKGFFASKPFLPITPGLIAQPVMGAGQQLLSLSQQRFYLRQAIPKDNPFLNAVLGPPKSTGH